MLRIAICDDSEASRKDVVNHLMDYSVKNNFDYTVDEYGSGDHQRFMKKEGKKSVYLMI